MEPAKPFFTRQHYQLASIECRPRAQLCEWPLAPLPGNNGMRDRTVALLGKNSHAKETVNTNINIIGQAVLNERFFLFLTALSFCRHPA